MVFREWPYVEGVCVAQWHIPPLWFGDFIQCDVWIQSQMLQWWFLCRLHAPFCCSWASTALAALAGSYSAGQLSVWLSYNCWEHTGVWELAPWGASCIGGALVLTGAVFQFWGTEPLGWAPVPARSACWEQQVWSQCVLGPPSGRGRAEAAWEGHWCELRPLTKSGRDGVTW